MSKGNRTKGTHGRFDFGESGYLDNTRRKSEQPEASFFTPYLRLCRKCGRHRPRKGGLVTADPNKWTCADCRTRSYRKREAAA